MPAPNAHSQSGAMTSRNRAKPSPRKAATAAVMSRSRTRPALWRDRARYSPTSSRSMAADRTGAPSASVSQRNVPPTNFAAPIGERTASLPAYSGVRIAWKAQAWA